MRTLYCRHLLFNMIQQRICVEFGSSEFVFVNHITFVLLSPHCKFSSLPVRSLKQI